MIEPFGGLVTIHNPVGRPIFDIAFRHDIPPAMREKVLSRIKAGLDAPEYDPDPKQGL